MNAISPVDFATLLLNFFINIAASYSFDIANAILFVTEVQHIRMYCKPDLRSSRATSKLSALVSDDY